MPDDARRARLAMMAATMPPSAPVSNDERIVLEGHARLIGELGALRENAARRPEGRTHAREIDAIERRIANADASERRTLARDLESARLRYVAAIESPEDAGRRTVLLSEIDGIQLRWRREESIRMRSRYDMAAGLYGRAGADHLYARHLAAAEAAEAAAVLRTS